MTEEIPSGWEFNTADFSVVAAGNGETGSVLLIRCKEQKELWHELVHDIEDDNLWPPLYVQGFGRTLEEAIKDAINKAEPVMKEEGILIPNHYTLTITPAIQPEKRHKLESCLTEMGFKVWGGGTNIDLTSCDITFD